MHRYGRMRAVSRRAALTLPLALGGCGLWSGWFGVQKPPIPGKKVPVLGSANALAVAPGGLKVVLPPPVHNVAWPQPGGNPAHLMGHLAARPALAEAWEAHIGSGGGYRAKVLAQPVVANGVVYTMDSEARITAFALSDGAVRWRFDTKARHNRSNNVGGGLGVSGGVLYAVNGLGDLVALDATRGTQTWRVSLGAPARSGPTIVERRIFVTTIEDRVVALDTAGGRRLWDYQAANAVTALLGEPAPAYANGIVVAGFASGELTALRADTGLVAWSDDLVATGVGPGLLDVDSIRGLPVINGNSVIAIGLGGMLVANDLYSGRRLWQLTVAGLDTPWVAGDWIFLVTLDQAIAAARVADGQVAWVRELPRWMNPKNRKNPITWFGPVLVSDRLVLAGTSKTALAVSPYTGDILGRQRLPGTAAPVGPVVADGTLLLIAEDGRLIALR